MTTQNSDDTAGGVVLQRLVSPARGRMLPMSEKLTSSVQHVVTAAACADRSGPQVPERAVTAEAALAGLEEDIERVARELGLSLRRLWDADDGVVSYILRGPVINQVYRARRRTVARVATGQEGGPFQRLVSLRRLEARVAPGQHRRGAEREVCVKHGCDKAPLIYLKRGESRQTENGFLIVKVPGWYCPKCSGSYGGAEPVADKSARRTKSGAGAPND